jgi:methyltransferase (TIGR00027 family)
MTEPFQLPSGVGVTALGIAQLRSSESARSDALIHDPLAALFVEAASSGLPWSAAVPTPSREGNEKGRWSSLANYVAVRTRFFDDCLRDACAAGLRQVVILGAGLDTRAFRLDWPAGTSVYEIDRPDVLAFKERVIANHGAAPRCRRSVVAADLEGDWQSPLAERGLNILERVAWLAEGLLIYLSGELVNVTIRRISEASRPGSRFALEHVSLEHLQGLRDAHAREGIFTFADRWQSALNVSPSDWLSSYGWDTTVWDTRERASALNRPISDPNVGSSTWLISGTRRDA